MRIRQMTMEDIPSVAEIERNCFSEPWSEQGFADGLKNSSVFFVVENDDCKIAGYIGMYVTVPEGEITNVAVARAERRKGFGEALVDAMQQWSSVNGVERIVLEVRVSNDSAIRVYEKKGFVTVGVRRNFYRFPTEDAGIMVWQR